MRFNNTGAVRKAPRKNGGKANALPPFCCHRGNCTVNVAPPPGVSLTRIAAPCRCAACGFTRDGPGTGETDARTAGSSASGETTQDDLPNPDLRDTIDAVDGTTLLLAPVRVTAQGEDGAVAGVQATSRTFLPCCWCLRWWRGGRPVPRCRWSRYRPRHPATPAKA